MRMKKPADWRVF
ncbi:hypothetical protein YPPY36_4992, partial [Yersinia pestis PY-36]